MIAQNIHAGGGGISGLTVGINPTFETALIAAPATLGQFLRAWRELFADAKLAMRARLLRPVAALALELEDAVHPP
jgi:hypothetical protein